MLDSPLFGILILDRDPIALANLAGLAQSWLQIAGGCAAVGLAAYILYAMLGSSDSESNKIRMPLNYWMLGMFAASVVLYGVYFFLMVTNRGPDPAAVKRANQDPNAYVKWEPPQFTTAAQPVVSALAGLCAILGIGQPFARDLLKLRMRRILALAKLGFKEAVRSRVFWVFLIFLIPFLFPVKWFFPIKPEDELRSTVRFTTLLVELLLLAAAMLLTAFSIPNDIKNQNIYTIVSKPVERFEIILGRFLGYTGLMTIALVGMATASVILIRFANIDDKAKEETFTARVPHRGKLSFQSRKGAGDGINVGREFDYRKYIGGAPRTSERAIWAFSSAPGTLTTGDKDAVRCEFTFDIFRLTKGEENRGVDVNIRFTTWKAEQVAPVVQGDGEWKWKDQAAFQGYVKAAAEKLGLNADSGTARQFAEGQWDALYPTVQARLGGIKPGSDKWAVVNELAEKFGFYEVPAKEVYDYHPTDVPVPVGLFKNARDGSPKGNEPVFQIAVKCTSGGQMLGMNDADLHMLEGVQPFELNYFKATVGLWCRVAIAIGIAVAFSTYLVGVISLLATLFIYISSYTVEHLKDVASGTNTGGGPLESLTRLLRTDMPTAQLDPTATVKTVQGVDTAYSWAFRQFFNVLPEIDSYTWTGYLKEGFNINSEYLLMNFVMLFGYLLPWGVLGYYLLRNREVAA